MDKTLRKADRQAATGDLDAGVRLLEQRTHLVPDLIVTCRDLQFPNGNSTCKGGRVPVHDWRVLPGRAGPTMAVLDKIDCSICKGTGKGVMPWEERWALAAYCGHDAARVLAPCDLCGDYLEHDLWSLDTWAKKLETRWPTVLIRATVVSAECALPSWYQEQSCPEGYGAGWYANHLHPESDEYDAPRRTVTAARRWLEDPTPENKKACEITPSSGLPWFVWGLSREICYGAAAGGMSGCYAPDAIQDAAQLTDVSQAIRDELIDWVLGNKWT